MAAPSESPSQYDNLDTLEQLLSSMTKDLLPGYADTVRDATLEDLNTNIAGLMSEAESKTLKDKPLARALGCMVLNLVAQLKLSDQDFERLRNRLVAEQQKQAQVSHRLTDLEAQLTDTQAQLNDSEMRRNETEAHLTAVEVKLIDVEAQRDDAEMRLDETTLQLTAATARITELNADQDSEGSTLPDESAELKRKNVELTQALTSSEQNTSEQERKLRSAATEIIELKKELTELAGRPPTAQLLEVRADYQRATHLLCQASDEIKELTDRIEALKRDRSSEMEQVYDAKTRLAIVEDKFYRLQRHSHDREDELAHTKRELQRARQLRQEQATHPFEALPPRSPVQNLLLMDTPVLHKASPVFGPEPTLGASQAAITSLGPAPQVAEALLDLSPHMAGTSRGPAPQAAASLRDSSLPFHQPAPQIAATASHLASQAASPFFSSAPQAAAASFHPAPQAAAAFPHLGVQPGMALRDLDKVARNIFRFEPKPNGSHDTLAYLKDIDFHLRRFPHATMDDKIYLLKVTSSRDVNNWIERQPAHVQADYQTLCQALTREFDDLETITGLSAALNVKQGRLESPQLYYSRLLKAYFGCRNEPNMEEDHNFKTLFVENLHPHTSHHLGVSACPRTLSSSQLRELAAKGFAKQKTPSTKNVEPAIFNVAYNPAMELEGSHQRAPKFHRPQPEPQHGDRGRTFSSSHRAHPPQNGPYRGPQQNHHDKSRPWLDRNPNPRRDFRESFARTDSRPRQNRFDNSKQKPSFTKNKENKPSDSSKPNSALAEEILEVLRNLSTNKKPDPPL